MQWNKWSQPEPQWQSKAEPKILHWNQSQKKPSRKQLPEALPYLFLLLRNDAVSMQVWAVVHRILLFHHSGCHWLYFSFIDSEQIQFTIIIFSDLPVFHPWIISNTQKKELLRSIMLMPILYKADTLQFSYWICSKKSVLAHHSYQGFWRRPKCPLYIGKNGLFLVSGKRNQVSCFARSPGKDPLPPEGVFKATCFHHSFLKETGSHRGRRAAWGYVGKRWQKRPGEHKEKKYRNRIWPLFQESLHQWRSKNGLAHLRGTNMLFKSTD